MKTSKKGYICILHILFVLWQLMNLDVVLSQTRVKSLPGFNGSLPFSLETGYIGVEGEELQLYYYFFESENDPKNDPLVFWMTGGPHCSGMSAILYEIGPFRLDEMTYNGGLPRVLLREHSWTKFANILFADLPVGTGFSYATTSRANYSGDFKASNTVDEFLRKWLENHTQYISNPFYMGGDSYAGFTLPLYFHRMVIGNEEGSKPIINLKGYLLGNPATNQSIDGNAQVPFSHGMGLISDEFFEIIDEIQTNHVLEDYCKLDYLRLQESFEKKRFMTENINKFYRARENGAFSCRKEAYKLALYWMNDESVQEALHVKWQNPIKWIRCNFGFNYSYEVISSFEYHAKLSIKGFRSLIYSGDHDLVVPFIGTQKWIRLLNYSIQDEWRKWKVDGQVAGFTRSYSNNMTFATIKGGGHTAPEYKPKQCATMFKRWISGDPL